MRIQPRHLRSCLAVALLTLLPPALLACGDSGGAVPPPGEPAAGPPVETKEAAMTDLVEAPLGSWVLESYTDESPVEEGSITLEFLADRRVAGSSGCNRYMGPYTIDDHGDLSFGRLASTMMACPEEIMDRERHYLATLTKVSAFRLDGEKLVLQFVEGQDLMVFRKAEAASSEEGRP